MKTGELVDLCYSKITGGGQTTEVRVTKLDIRAFIAPAINYSLLEQYYLNVRSNEPSVVPEEFVATYENQPVLFNSARNLKYVLFPAKVVPLPANSSVQTISDMFGETKFYRMPNQFSSDGYEKNLSGTVMYWVERGRAYFKNLPDSVKKVLLQLVGSINEFDDDEDLPIPAGHEIKVIKVICDHFTGQREIPEDTKNDSSDQKK